MIVAGAFGCSFFDFFFSVGDDATMMTHDSFASCLLESASVCRYKVYRCMILVYLAPGRTCGRFV